MTAFKRIKPDYQWAGLCILGTVYLIFCTP